MPKPRNTRMRYRKQGSFHAKAIEKDLKKMKANAGSSATIRSDARSLGVGVEGSAGPAADSTRSDK